MAEPGGGTQATHGPAGDGAPGTCRAGPAPAVEDLGHSRLDLDRADRTGDPEVVYGPGKTPQQVTENLRVLHARHPARAVLATRLDPDALDLVARSLPAARVDRTARTALLGPLPEPRGVVGVLSAGTSDGPVAAEAAVSIRCHGAAVELVPDVGVAGLHRLLAVRDRLDSYDALVVVAGMEGALPSVVGGLTGVPLVAVPTSTGYGTGLAGLTAMAAMLNSCAPGVVVVNIDNGYGAGVHAARVARRSHPSPPPGQEAPQQTVTPPPQGRAR